MAGDVEGGGAVEVCEGDRDFNGDCAVVVLFPARRNVMDLWWVWVCWFVLCYDLVCFDCEMLFCVLLLCSFGIFVSVGV